jgi:Beta/Gamma crystallin
MTNIRAIVLVMLLTLPGTLAETKGSCEVIVYWDANFGGEARTSSEEFPYVGDHWNDRISSIRVIGGVWQFYEHANYFGAFMQLGPGSYSYVGHQWNDRISSFRCDENRDFGNADDIR